MLAVALVVGLWSGAVAKAFDPVHPARDTHTSYVVRHGDTLWSIAVRVAPGTDPRPVVDAIAAANDLRAGALVPGQTLSIPT